MWFEPSDILFECMVHTWLFLLECFIYTHRQMHHYTLTMSWLYSENKLQLWFWNEMGGPTLQVHKFQEAQKPFNIYLQPYCRGFFAMLLQLKENTGTANSPNLCTCSFTNVSLREIVCQRSEDLVEQVKSQLLVWLASVYGKTLCLQKDWNNLSNVVFLKELLPVPHLQFLFGKTPFMSRKEVTHLLWFLLNHIAICTSWELPPSAVIQALQFLLSRCGRAVTCVANISIFKVAIIDIKRIP